MAYTILNTDGTTLMFLSDNSIDQAATSLTLVGKNYNNYGQYINNNFVSLLENFASTNGEEPRSPRRGQLWYDTTGRRLNVYDEEFTPVGGAIVSGSQPITLSSGDLWWDSANDQLKIFNNNALFVVGPPFPRSVGENGFILPSATVVDAYTSNAQQVTLLKNYGETIGALSNSEFTMTSSDSQAIFGVTTSTLVQGLTISGDLKVSGQMSNRYLSTTVDISYLPMAFSSAANKFDVSEVTAYNDQNTSIINYLKVMFPVSANTTYSEPGVPIGSEARVICVYNSPGQGMQIRRFRIEDDDIQGISWQPVSVYVSTGTNAVVTTSLVNVMPL